jgi:7,8-dihydroneopterin aldolase/epimerase/oxygenase
MGIIAIEGMKFYAFHGYYRQEQLIGTEFLVDVYVEVNITKAANSDQLIDTVNYETIYRIAKAEMSKKSKLIENVAERIIFKIKSFYANIEGLKVRISKLNPPLGNPVARTFIEMNENYRKHCGKCNKEILVQSDGDCWEKYGRIFPERKANLLSNFGNNLCRLCIEPYLIQKPDDNAED